MSMLTNVQFANELSFWAVDVPDITDVVTTWNNANNLRIDDPVTALRDQVRTGAIGPDDIAKAIAKAATLLAANAHAQQIVPDLDQPLDVRFTTAVMANCDAIVEQLEPHFAKAAADLTTAAQAIGANVTAEEVLGLGTNAVNAWHTLANAGQRLDSIAAIRAKLNRNYNYEHGYPEAAAFIGPVLTEKDLNRVVKLLQGIDAGQRLEPARGGVWEHAMRGGYTLHLNTRDEAARIINAVVPTPDPVAA